MSSNSIKDINSYKEDNEQGGEAVAGLISAAQESVFGPDSELSIPLLEGIEKTRIKSSEVLEKINPVYLGELIKILEGKTDIAFDNEHRKCLMIISGYIFRYFKPGVSKEYHKIQLSIAQDFIEYTNNKFDHRGTRNSINQVCSKNGFYSKTDEINALWAINLFDKKYPFGDHFVARNKISNKKQQVKKKAIDDSVLSPQNDSELLVSLLLDNFSNPDDLIKPTDEQKKVLSDLLEELSDYFPSRDSKDPEYSGMLRKQFRRSYQGFPEIGNAFRALSGLVNRNFGGISSKDLDRIYRLIDFRANKWPQINNIK